MFWMPLILSLTHLCEFLKNFYFMSSNHRKNLPRLHRTDSVKGEVLTNGTIGVNVCFELGGKTEEWRPLLISHHCPPASPFPLIFPWRSIKTQPFERVHWFLGIFSDKMRFSTRSSFNYPIWGPLIWQGHAGTVNRAVNLEGVSRKWRQ